MGLESACGGITETGCASSGGASITVLDTATIDLSLPASILSASVIPSGVDHNSLANLTVGDPHTQYGLKSGKLSQFSSTTSAELLGVISDETGTGALVFAASAALVTPILGTPTSGVLTNCTGLPLSTGTTGILAATRGGTSFASYTVGDMLYANTTTTLAKIPAGFDGQVLGTNTSVPMWADPFIASSSSTVGLDLTDGTLTADVIPGGISHNSLTGLTTGDPHTQYALAAAASARAGTCALFTQTADKTVTNTVTETSIVGTGVGTMTLPANLFIAGKTIRLRIGGVYSTPAIATPSIIIKVKYGAIVLATVTTSSLLSGATNLEFDGEILITCRTTGTSGTVMTHGDIEYATGVAGTISVDPLNNAAAATTINTTTSNLLDITVQWDTNTSTRIVKSTVTTVEILN